MSLTVERTRNRAAKWQTSIGELCDEFGGDVQTGPFGSQLHASDYSQEGTPLAMPRDLIEGRIVCDQIARIGTKHVQRLNRHVLKIGDIVFSRRGDVTRFAVVTPDEAGWLCGTGCIRIRLNCPDIDVGYLRRYLEQESIGKWLLHQAKGITMPNLNTKIVRGLPFVYPPLDQQKRIAGILDAADALRAKRREALAQLDTLLQSTFLDMFGDPVTNPMGWEVRTLESLIDEDRPITYGILKPGPDIENGIPYVRVVDIQNQQVLTAQLRRTTKEIADQYKRSRLKPGDLLMSIRGHVGRMAITPADVDGANITQDTARLALSDAEATFVMQCISTQAMQRYMARRTKGVAVQGINLGDVKKLPIFTPPLSLQRRFAAIVESVERQKARMRAHLAELDALFASLQSRAFNGEL